MRAAFQCGRMRPSQGLLEAICSTCIHPRKVIDEALTQTSEYFIHGLLSKPVQGMVSNFSASSNRSDSLRNLDHPRSSQSTLGMDRVDNLDDLGSLLTDEEKLDSVTACDMPSSCQDGMLDIVSIRGAFHLGQIRVGLSHAQRLCQCREATVIIKRKTAVHIDGEPWRQTVSTLHLKRKKEPAIMLHRSPDESGGIETEVGKLLDWAEERQIIDRNVHSSLMKEFSRRIETKTRQKRVRSQENLMLSLSRAIGRTNSLPANSQKAYPSSISF